MRAIEHAPCPRCGAPRVDGPECPRCGVIYAKARAAPLEAALLELPTSWAPTLDHVAIERKIRLFAIPVALAVAWAAVSVDTLHFLARTFLSMWIHELGHASTAWLCGFAAFPGPWFTPISEGRIALVPVVVGAALGGGAWWSWRQGRPWLLAASATLLLSQLVCTFALTLERAHALAIFGGDAGALVWGTALMLTMYAPAESHLRKGGLRWGFLLIGAVAFMDVLDTWRAANADFAAIPFGENEGVTQSDATKLVDQYGWGIKAMIHRHLQVAAACAVVLAAAWVRGVIALRGAGGAPERPPPENRQ